MPLTMHEVAQVYRKRARHYDFTANLYYLAGFREKAYRRMAVHSLGLHQGDTVIELGCGSGLNFSLIQRVIGPWGKLIGVDLTPEMLAQARQRVKRHGWRNVDLIQSRASEYLFPTGINGILSTFALTLESEYDAVIGRGAAALIPGGRFVIMDFKVPEHWPQWLISFWVWTTRPFGVTLDLGERHPWGSIARHLNDYQFRSVYWGLAYIAVGTKKQSCSYRRFGSAGSTACSTSAYPATAFGDVYWGARGCVLRTHRGYRRRCDEVATSR